MINVRCRWDERPLLCRLAIHRPTRRTDYLHAKTGPGQPSTRECLRCGYSWWATIMAGLW